MSLPLYDRNVSPRFAQLLNVQVTIDVHNRQHLAFQP